MHLGVAFVPLPECSMISHEAKFSAWFEDPVEVRKRVGLHDAALVMAPFRPRVAEVDVHRMRNAVGQSMAEEIAGIRQQDADMLEFVSSQAIRRGAPEVCSPFDAEKIAVRLDGCLLTEKGPLAGSDLDFQRIRRTCEENTRIPSAGVVGWYVGITQAKVADVEALSACRIHRITRR